MLREHTTSAFLATVWLRPTRLLPLVPILNLGLLDSEYRLQLQTPILYSNCFIQIRPSFSTQNSNSHSGFLFLSIPFDSVSSILFPLIFLWVLNILIKFKHQHKTSMKNVKVEKYYITLQDNHVTKKKKLCQLVQCFWLRILTPTSAVHLFTSSVLILILTAEVDFLLLWLPASKQGALVYPPL